MIGTVDSSNISTRPFYVALAIVSSLLSACDGNVNALGDTGVTDTPNVDDDDSANTGGDDDDATASDDDDVTSTADDDDSDDDDSTVTGDDDDATATGDDDDDATDTDDDDDATSADDDDDTGDPLPICEDPGDGNPALERPGLAADGGIVLHDGRKLYPTGDTIVTDIYPMSMVLTPDGSKLVVANSGNAAHSLAVLDTDTWKVLSVTPLSSIYIGLVFDSQNRLYVATGQGQQVHRYTLADTGELTFDKAWAVDEFPTGLALNRDETALYVTRNYAPSSGFITRPSKLVRRINLADDTFSDLDVRGYHPYAVWSNADDSRVFVTNEGNPGTIKKWFVAVMDRTTNPPTRKDIEVAKNPEQIVASPDGTKLYVVATDADQIEVIDVASAAKVDSIALDDNPRYSIAPTAAAISPDGATLYVTSAVRNSIEVVDIATKTVKGSIPTGLYPIDVKLSSDGGTLFWLAGKGTGAGPLNDPKGNINRFIKGMVGRATVPNASELAELTEKVESGLVRRSLWTKDCRPAGAAMPEKPGVGVRSEKIKHVMLIVKENLTYDITFSDLPFGERDESLLEFGEDLTPNQHRLAREFVLMDNFYCEMETSVQGHLWLTGLASNNFSEKTWPPDYRNGARTSQSGVALTTMTGDLTFGGFVVRNGLTFRNYGEIVGTGDPDVARNTNTKFGFYNTNKSELEKIPFIIEDIEAGNFPDYIYVLLPNDHTNGRSPGQWTPEWMVADNDYGTGLLVDAVSHSPYWEETFIFITEDDTQHGPDHVEAHRTVALAVSPWVKRNKLSSVHYSFASFFKTATTLLGLLNFNGYDAVANPFFDIWAEEPDFSPYDAIKPDIWETPVFNIYGAPGSWEAMHMYFEEPDQNEDLGRVNYEARREIEAEPDGWKKWTTTETPQERPELFRP